MKKLRIENEFTKYHVRYVIISSIALAGTFIPAFLDTIMAFTWIVGVITLAGSWSATAIIVIVMMYATNRQLKVAMAIYLKQAGFGSIDINEIIYGKEETEDTGFAVDFDDLSESEIPET